MNIYFIPIVLVIVIVIAVVCVVQSSKKKGKGSHHFEMTTKKSKDDEGELNYLFHFIITHSNLILFCSTTVSSIFHTKTYNYN